MVISSNKAAELLQISKSTLYKWTAKGLIPFYKPTGKNLYFKKEELQNWIERSRVGTIEEELNASGYVGGKGE